MYTLVRKSTGEVIDPVRSLEHGLYLIRVNESEDKELGIFASDDYDVLDEKGESIL